MSDKWYNSKFGKEIGQGLAIGLILAGMGSGTKACNYNTKYDVEMEKAKYTYNLKRTEKIKDLLKDEGYIKYLESRKDLATKLINSNNDFADSDFQLKQILNASLGNYFIEEIK